MKMKKFIASAFALTMLASCGGAKKPNVDDIVNGFETSLTGTASLTFNSVYKTDVISEKGGMDSFKHDVNDKVVADIDLTEGSLYLYVKNDSQDKGVEKTREALLYNESGKYKFVTTVMENPLELKDEAAAKAKIDELLHKISKTYTGSIDTKSLVYTKGGAYEHKEFGLSTENQAPDEFVDEPSMEATDAGVAITGDLTYIGYNTDAGISDFPGKDGANAGSYTINTNTKGYVTSYVESMDAELAMPIMTPAPIVTIKGSKTLNAKFGETIEKKTTIEHKLTTTKLTITPTTFGTVEAFTLPTMGAEKTPVTTDSTLTVGQFLAVKVTPAGKNTIKMVTFADTSKETPDTDGYFYFEIPEGKASLTVNFVGSDVIENVKYATINVTAAEGINVVATNWFTLVNGAPDGMKPVTDNKVPFGKDNWVAFTVTAPEGKNIKATCDAGDVTFLMNAYCVNLKDETTYNVKFELDEGPVVNYNASMKPLNNDYGMFGSVEIYTCKPGDFTNLRLLGAADADKLVAGEWLCIKVKEGANVTNVTVNEKTCMGGNPDATGGFYCFTIVEGVNTLNVVKA